MTVTATPVERLIAQHVSTYRSYGSRLLTLPLVGEAALLVLSAGSSHLLWQQMQYAFACALSAHSRLSSAPHCPVESAGRRLIVEMASAAQQYCLGRRLNCSEDDIVIAHVRKAKRFPGFEVSTGGGQHSFERAGANSFTRRQISISQ